MAIEAREARARGGTRRLRCVATKSQGISKLVEQVKEISTYREHLR
jgi:hypothetical protein